MPKITNSILYGGTCEVETQEEADEFYAAILDYCEIEHEQSREEADTIQRENIGYWTGYYDNKTAIQVQRLFKCQHPVFGSMAEDGPPTPAEALEAGIKLSEERGGS